MPRVPRAVDIGGSQIASPANAPQINTGVAASIGASGRAWGSAIAALGDAFGSIASKAGEANDQNEIYKIKLDWMEKSAGVVNDIEQNVDSTGDKWQELQPRFQGLREEFGPRLDRISDPRKRAALEFDMSKDVIRYGQRGLDNYRSAKIHGFDQEMSANIDRAASQLSANPDMADYERYQSTLIDMANAGRDKYVPQARVDERVRQIRGALLTSLLNGLARKGDGEDALGIMEKMRGAGFEVERSGDGSYTARDVQKPRPGASLSGDRIGSVSAKYESGGRGVGMISSGKGDPGGPSYGIHQLSSKDSMGAFLRSPEGRPYVNELGGLRPGTAEFNSVYRKLTAADPRGMEDAQYAFYARTHFQPVLEHAKAAGFAVEDRGVQEALFSMAIQHGGAKKIVSNASGAAGGSPQSQIAALYEARSAYVENVNLPADTKASVLNRYKREVRDALAMAGQSQPNQVPAVAGQRYASLSASNDVSGPAQQVEIKDPVRTARQSFAALYPGTDANTVISDSGEIDLSQMSLDERERITKFIGKDGVDLPHSVDGDRIMLDRGGMQQVAQNPEVQGYIGQVQEAAASNPDAPLTEAIEPEALHWIGEQRPDIAEKLTGMTVGQAAAEMEKAGVSTGIGKKPSAGIPYGRMLSGQTIEYTSKSGQTYRFTADDFNAIDPRMRQQLDRDLKEIVTLRRKNEESLVNGMMDKQISAIENTGKDHSEFDMNRVRSALRDKPESIRKFESRLELAKQVNRVINDAANVPNDVLEERLMALNEHIGDSEASPEAVRAKAKAETFIKRLRDVREKDPGYAVRDSDLVRDALSRVPGGIPKTPTDIYNVADAMLRKQQQLGLEPTPLTKAQAKAIIDPISHATSPAQKRELALSTVGKLVTDYKEHAQLALDSAMRLASSDKQDDRNLLSMSRWRRSIESQTNAAIDTMAKSWRPPSPWDERAPAGGWDDPSTDSLPRAMPGVVNEPGAVKRLKPNRFDAVGGDVPDDFFKLKK